MAALNWVWSCRARTVGNRRQGQEHSGEAGQGGGDGSTGGRSAAGSRGHGGIELGLELQGSNGRARFDSQFACQTRQEFAENRAKRKSLRLAQKKRGS